MRHWIGGVVVIALALTVAMTNSPFATLPDDARRAKAQAIAQPADLTPQPAS
jgi:hypothetical protein